MKLSIKNRLKVLMTGNVSDHVTNFLTGKSISNNKINADTAMKYSAVASCLRVRAETFASVPAVLYKKEDEDTRKAMSDLNIFDIFHNKPNEEMAPFGFKETLLTNFDISGNVVCERLVNKSGELVGLYPYKHSMVSIERNKETKALEYKVRNGTESKILKRHQVLHVPNMSFDGVIGLSPIQYAASTIRLGLAYEEYGNNFYKNAATPSGVFESPNKLSDTGFARLKKGIKENYTGLKNAGIPMMLEEGLSWKQVTINPIDAQLLESKNFQIEDVCRIYRVPQHMIGKLDRSTNNNIEHQSLEFVMYTMLPIFKRFEDNINSQLLTRKQRAQGYYVEFKIDGLLRGDAKSRAESYAIGRQWGWLSVNDIRKLENLPPIPNGNIYLQPMNHMEAGKENEPLVANKKLVEDIYNMIKERK